MRQTQLVAALEPLVGAKLASDMVASYAKIRVDLATRTLERASPGKFVETFVQCLQNIATGAYDAVPKVDHYLSKVAENETAVPEGLRIIGARIARSIYSVRNKRNIAHKGEVDPNWIDLAYAHHGAVWIMAELVRTSSAVSMEEAHRMLALLEAPVGGLVEDIEGVRLVHGAPNVRAEVLILLHSHYPDPVALAAIKETLSRRGRSTASNTLRELERQKLVQGDPASGYRLTRTGFAAALREVNSALEAA